MAAAPFGKVYRLGEYVASCKYPEDPAALVTCMGGEIRAGHSRVVWTEGKEEFSAGESYDGVRDLCVARANFPKGGAR
jgi:hypothetical protein